jgi:hypothetical protein
MPAARAFQTDTRRLEVQQKIMTTKPADRLTDPSPRITQPGSPRQVDVQRMTVRMV